MCMCMYVCMHECHGVGMGLREKFAGISSLHVNPGDRTQDSGLHKASLPTGLTF